MRINKILTVIIMFALLVPLILAYAAEPGSPDDPLVSKSYVDAKIAEALNQTGAQSGQVPQASQSAGAFTPVNLYTGQIVTGDEGTEMILRSGSGVAYHTGDDGIVDITDGQELFNGDETVKNHLIIVPRSDGRGIMVLEDSWLIIKGGYHIAN